MIDILGFGVTLTYSIAVVLAAYDGGGARKAAAG